jgi:quinol monooxygenase YgiN
MGDYVIIVDFRLKPKTRAHFRRLIDANAAASIRSEPGCRRFDVLEPKGEQDRIVLYEIYRDRAAFEEHLRMPHFAAFEVAAAAMVDGKSVMEYELICEATEANEGLATEAAPSLAPSR